MILVDTSIWIDPLRAGEPRLVELLNAGRTLAHPFVIGELACGNLKNREAVLSLLQNLPAVPVATDDEVLFFIEKHGLMGRGIGYVDAHLLSAVSLAGTGRLWTRDKHLLGRYRYLSFAGHCGGGHSDNPSNPRNSYDAVRNAWPQPSSANDALSTDATLRIDTLPRRPSQLHC